MSTKNDAFFRLVEKRRHTSGERLKEARKKSGAQQVEIAERLEKDRTTISNWERGKSSPSIDDFLILSSLYDEPIARLMALDEIINKKTVYPLSKESLEIDNELNEIEGAVAELQGKPLPPGASAEYLRSAVRLIQTFLEAIEKHD